MTDTTAAPAGGASNKPFCVHCVSGFRLPGEPKGRFEKIQNYQVYVSEPKDGVKDASKAIVFFTDVLGLNLNNNKILPDMLADATGLKVYTPDMFDGDCIPESAIESQPGSAEEAKKLSIFTKVFGMAKMATVVPWFIKHRHGKSMDQLGQFVEHVKTQFGHQRIGGIGYCYGGKHVIVLNGKGILDVSVANHPSLVSNADIASLRNPILFNCAEDDAIFPASYAKKVEKELDEKKDGHIHVFKHYPNTVHGFGARPNLAVPEVKQAFEQAFASAVEFYQAHL